MAFAGGVGAHLELSSMPELPTAARLFSESNSRFLCEVAPENTTDFEAQMAGMPCAHVGETYELPRLVIADAGGKMVIDAELGDLKAAWKRPLAW
jgi:phosphoribosylformylglycinamidine synthase